MAKRPSSPFERHHYAEIAESIGLAVGCATVVKLDNSKVAGWMDGSMVHGNEGGAVRLQTNNGAVWIDYLDIASLVHHRLGPQRFAQSP
jgi:hypothetical protein